MTVKTTARENESSAKPLQGIAEALVQARLSAGCLDQYPGETPGNLDIAYQIQDRAIDLWPDELSGWKVGRIPPQLEDEFGSDRLAGPIFDRTIHRQNDGEETDMPVFADGFAAVEAEFVAVISEDAPAEKLDWSRDEAEAMIAELHVGLEVASSPLGAINDLGPAVTASDFGNNAGLIIGAVIPDWCSRDPETLTSATYVDDHLSGEGGAYTLTGGVTRSVQFMLELAAKRGRPLHAGDVIATGQTSGIHEVSLGQVARIEFGNDGRLACKIVAATDSAEAD